MQTTQKPNGPPTVKERLLTHLSNGVTQAQLSRETGLSASAISRWLKGNYDGDNDAVTTRLTVWLNQRERRPALVLPEGPAWIETPTAQKVLSTLQYSHLLGCIAVVAGAAGVGKTTAIKRYASTFPQVWVATMRPATASIVTSLEEVCEALGVEGARGGAAKLDRQLLKLMRGTKGLLIIDEAQHLSIQAIESLRALHDAAGIGLALVGNDIVYDRLSGKEHGAGFAQLFSRIGKRTSFKGATAGDASALLKGWGISGTKEQKIAKEIALSRWGLRGLTYVLKMAGMASNGGTITSKDLGFAWRELSSGAKSVNRRA